MKKCFLKYLGVVDFQNLPLAFFELNIATFIEITVRKLVKRMYGGK